VAPDDSRNQDAAAALVTLVAGWYGRVLDHTGDPGRVLLRQLHGAVVRRFCALRGFMPPHGLPASRQPLPCPGLGALLGDFRASLRAPGTTALLTTAPALALGQAYERCLALSQQGKARKAAGVYYTPAHIADALIEQTVGALCTEMAMDELARGKSIDMRVLDPACGTGVFLVRAYRRLWFAHRDHWRQEPASAQRGRVVRAGQHWRLTLAESFRILDQCIAGMDLDAHALALARLALVVEALELCQGEQPDVPDVFDVFDVFDDKRRQWPRCNLSCGDALAVLPGLGPGSGSGRGREGGFDAVLGNPPWGQKAIVASAAVKARVRREYPSSAGIFDWFRPFVELGIRLTREGGYFGMVLPDIVLLKNYEPTRRHVLDHLSIERIEWLGRAFPGATIDAVTIAGRRAAADPRHRVEVVVQDPAAPLHHFIEQAEFRDNPRCTFNLHLTGERRRAVAAVREHPRLARLGDYFEVHEGVHSGNIRAELFVCEKLDESCRELLFGRDELRPYSLKWAGYHVRLSALPERRTRARYANLGQRRWHETPKVLIRRTGDRVMAAVDPDSRYASNNFFVVLPRATPTSTPASTSTPTPGPTSTPASGRAHPLDLDGLAALMNSAFITWYFQAIEPRKGRAFAEIKIKHLIEFPLPPVEREAACQRLNQLGAEQRRLAAHAPLGQRGAAGARLDRETERAVLDALELSPGPAALHDPEGRALPASPSG
jgi:hypothetical protein